LFIFILKITKTATKFSTTETKMFTISRTKNTQVGQTSGLVFFFTSLRLILRASYHLLISKTRMGQKNGQSSYLKVGVGDKVGSREFQKPLQFPGWVLNRQLQIGCHCRVGKFLYESR
jgi:hypothetical protein